jgi:hypothetical protein
VPAPHVQQASGGHGGHMARYRDAGPPARPQCCRCCDRSPVLQVLLRYQGKDLAVVEVTSKWQPSKPLEAKQCYGTTCLGHPGVQMISMERGKYYIGGKVHGLSIPKR